MDDCVLIVDDSLTVRMDLVAGFAAAGFEVLPCASAGEARAVLAQREVPLVVLDVLLPDADGVEFVEEIRATAQGPMPVILMLSAEAEVKDRIRGLRTGADEYVGKPYDIGYVVGRAGELLRTRNSRRIAASTSAGTGTRSLLGPSKILGVDDSNTFLQVLGETLRGEGYDVILARSGEEALELLKVQAVDCILLDLLMPGIGGQETCRRIKVAPKMREVPVIMLTSMEDRSVMIESLGAGADDYITKSDDFEVLKARLRAQIRRKQFEDENRRIQEELSQIELETARARSAFDLAEARAKLVQELELKNRELEAFSWSVAHDLRSPLRSIDGFCQLLLEDCADKLGGENLDYLHRVRAEAQRMGELIDDLLSLSQVSRAGLVRERMEFSELGALIVAELHQRSPGREVECVIEPGMVTVGDARLLRVMLENLLGNAWKFSGKAPSARIEFGQAERGTETVYFVKDNGVGFNMAYAARLFGPFQRLHAETDFPGTGIGLATVQRIVDRHGGRVWAESELGRGATFWFTNPSEAA